MGRKAFEMHELEAFLGEYAADFDADAIIAEATEIDYSTGNRYWREDIDLNEIAARHELRTVTRVKMEITLMHQNGDSYDLDTKPYDDEVLEFETKDKAVEWVKKDIERRGYWYEVTQTRRGLDSIEYHEYMIDTVKVDIDGEVVEWVDEDTRLSITQEVQDAIDMHQGQYWSYLDRETDCYLTLAECIEKAAR